MWSGSGSKSEEKETRHSRASLMVVWILFHQRPGWGFSMVFRVRVFLDSGWPAPTLRKAIQMVQAREGGWRKGDGEPGSEILWRGIQKLDDISAMMAILIDLPNLPMELCPDGIGMGKLKSRGGRFKSVRAAQRAMLNRSSAPI
jgi:hypothetical protein